MCDCDRRLLYLGGDTGSETLLPKVIGWDPNSLNYETITELQQKLASAVLRGDTVMQLGAACGDLARLQFFPPLLGNLKTAAYM